MNDRFKFRAFVKANEEIENVDDINYDAWEVGGKPLIIVGGVGRTEDEIVLMQSTGLKDKNGKLIYEMDFVKYLDYICEIVYKRGAFILEVRKGKKDGFFHFYDMHNSFLEVIGNKFETPELLKECENE